MRSGWEPMALTLGCHPSMSRLGREEVSCSADVVFISLELTAVFGLKSYHFSKASADTLGLFIKTQPKTTTIATTNHSCKKNKTIKTKKQILVCLTNDLLFLCFWWCWGMEPRAW